MNNIIIENINIKNIIKKLFIFIIIIIFGKNPKKGGNPPNEIILKNKNINKNLFFNIKL